MKIPECGLLEPKHVGEHIFVIIQFKYLSTVSAYCWNCLNKCFIFFRYHSTGPHFEPDESSVPHSPVSQTSCFLIIHLSTRLSPIRRQKLRVVVKFLTLFFISAVCVCVCVLNIVGTPLLKHFVCTLFLGLRLKTLLLKNSNCLLAQ